MNSQLEKAVALHCAPVLIGRKPAAIVCLPAMPAMALVNLSRSLKQYGVRAFPLRKQSGRVLLMLFAPERLAEQLGERATAKALAAQGYPLGNGGCSPGMDLPQCLLHLRLRFQREQASSPDGAFPHEIGFFLGYPYEDVLGFMRHGGRNCKCAGLWKVYGDVDRAQRLFADYESCRDTLGAHIEAGGTLANFLQGHEIARPMPVENRV